MKKSEARSRDRSPRVFFRIDTGGRVTRGLRFRGPARKVKPENRKLFIASAVGVFALVGVVIYVNRRRRLRHEEA